MQAKKSFENEWEINQVKYLGNNRIGFVDDNGQVFIATIQNTV